MRRSRDIPAHSRTTPMPTSNATFLHPSSPRLSRLSSPATAGQEECQRDDGRCRQEKSIVQSPARAEERVDNHPGKEKDKRDHQPDTDSVPAIMAGHERNIGLRSSRRGSPPAARCSRDIPAHSPTRVTVSRGLTITSARTSEHAPRLVSRSAPRPSIHGHASTGRLRLRGMTVRSGGLP